jgi:hypothetical protein
MDNKVKWGLVGLVLLGSATLAQAQQTGTTEKTIAALEEKWTQSQKTNNPDLISAHWSDKLVSTGTDGTVSNRAQTLAPQNEWWSKSRTHLGVGGEAII